jgi:hypothetical protein
LVALSDNVGFHIGNLIGDCRWWKSEDQTHEGADAFSNGRHYGDKDHGEIHSYIEYDYQWFYQNPRWLRLLISLSIKSLVQTNLPVGVEVMDPK